MFQVKRTNGRVETLPNPLKLEIPIFVDEELACWVYKANKFFFTTHLSIIKGL